MAFDAKEGVTGEWERLRQIARRLRVSNSRLLIAPLQSLRSWGLVESKLHNGYLVWRLAPKDAA